jgi:Fur family ferric uptake transcriptional regulator
MDDLAERLRTETDFELDPSHVALSGICRACRDTAPDELT